MTNLPVDTFLLLLAVFCTYCFLSEARHNLWRYCYGRTRGELWIFPSSQRRYLRLFVVCTLSMLFTSLAGLTCAFMAIGLL